MEDLEGHLWSQSFLRLISQSNDETKLRALQQIILHSQGTEQESKESAKKINNLKPKPARKSNSPKNLPMDSFKINDLSDNCSKIPKPKRFFALSSPKITNKSSITPIMGKWALLTKYNKILKDNSDAEIVTKIVMEKFKNILNNYHKRTVIRKSTNEDNTEDANFDSSTQLVAPKDNSSETKLSSIESIEDAHLDVTYQTMDPLWEEDEESLEDEVFVEDLSEKAKNEVLDQIISIHDQLLEQDLEEENPNQKEEALFEEKLHYDAQKFLEAALGDELKDYSSVKTDNDDYAESSYPHGSNEYESSSVNTSQVSNLCRASTYLFNMLSGKNRNPINPNESSIISYEEPFIDSTPSNSKASHLIHEAAAQNQIILQTCKALNFCERSKQFKSSTEYIEAERILLLATLKYEAAKRELQKVDYEDMKDLGQVTISDLIFPMAREVPQGDEFSQWCVAVLSCGTNVLATETLRAQDCDIKFDKSFNFENLDVDFEITASIYTLYVKNYPKSGGHDLKFHTKQETTTCPTPKLINFRKLNKSPKPADDYERRHSSFLLLGTCTLRLADLSKPTPLKLTRVPKSSILKGIVNANLSSSIDLTSTYSGFLTIGSEAGGYATWNRRWCYLNGYELQYWNYPGEEELSKPIGCIDLRFCVASRVNQVDRELCARPRTLLLETGRISASKDKNSLMVLCRSSYTITKHYLSADNHKEMAKWQNKLNSVVSMLRNWNCMKCQLYFAR